MTALETAGPRLVSRREAVRATVGALALGAMAFLSLREKVVPTWIGVVSAIGVLAPLAMLVMTGLPGFPGLVGPLWLVVTGIGLAVSGRRAT